MIVDLHSHLIPGVDDGAQSPGESKRALSELAGQDVGRLITTPHVDGSLSERPDALAARLEELDAGWRRLQEVAGDDADAPDVLRGAEVKLDTPEPALDDDRLRLAGTRFVLVEFPHLMIPPESARALFHISANGWVPVLAHPERYRGVEREIELASEWRRVGARLQVNAGSVEGRYGSDARRAALELLRRGWVDYLSSDYHARGRLDVQACRETLLAMGGEEQARLLMEANPTRLARDEDPIPVPSLESQGGLLSRIFARFGLGARASPER